MCIKPITEMPIVSLPEVDPYLGIGLDDTEDHPVVREVRAPTSRGFRVGEPEPYNGTPTQYRAFHCQLYLYLVANYDVYDTNEKKIILTLSFLGGGVAKLWAQMYLDDVIKNETWGSWKGFQGDLENAFADKNEKRRAVVELEKLHQGKDLALEFFVKIKQLLHMAKLTMDDGPYMMNLIEKGLSATLVNKIYASGVLPKTYHEYKERAIAINDLWRQRQMM